MSAFMLPDAHIRLLVDYAHRHGCLDGDLDPNAAADLDARTAFGRRLLAANAASVQARYGEDAADMGVDAADTFEAGPLSEVAVPAIAILRACACFDYQACEVEHYPRSWAAPAIGLIRRAACSTLIREVHLPAALAAWPVEDAGTVTARGRLRWVE